MNAANVWCGMCLLVRITRDKLMFYSDSCVPKVVNGWQVAVFHNGPQKLSHSA